MTQEEKFRWIDDYLNGNLSTEQQALFKQELKRDANLAEEVSLQQDILIGIESALDKEFQKIDFYQESLNGVESFNDNELKNHFATLEKELSANEDNIIPIRRRQAHRTLYYYLSGIAAILILGFFIYMFWQIRNKPEQLFAKYYEPYMIATVDRDESSNLSTQEQAKHAYEIKDYERAAALFITCVDSISEEMSCSFFLGLSYIGTNQFKKAERYLEQVVNSPSNKFSSQSKWYLALVYLKLKKIDASVNLLKKLKLEQGFYGDKATKLLKEL